MATNRVSQDDVIGTYTTRGRDTYLFLWNPTAQHRRIVLRTAGKWAADRELSFTWKDADKVAKEMRREFEGIE